MTQTELGRRVGVTAATIRKIEADERRPSLQVAGRLADHLQVPASQRDAFLAVARGKRAVDRLETAPISVDTLTPPAGNLPAPPNALLGRDRELADLDALLVRSDVRLVTLTGPGGAGKTRLALEVAARRSLASLPDGTWFVDLSPVREPSQVAAAILAALDVPELSNQPAPERLVAWLRARRLLLVLDTFEHLVEAAPFIGEVLRAAPGVCVLATSRLRLQLAAEWEYPVGALDDIAATELFAIRAQAVQPGFSLTVANREAVAAICARLDGLPLAIELAAVRTKLFASAVLLARLNDGGLWQWLGGSR